MNSVAPLGQQQQFDTAFGKPRTVRIVCETKHETSVAPTVHATKKQRRCGRRRRRQENVRVFFVAVVAKAPAQWSQNTVGMEPPALQAMQSVRFDLDCCMLVVVFVVFVVF